MRKFYNTLLFSMLACFGVLADTTITIGVSSSNVLTYTFTVNGIVTNGGVGTTGGVITHGTNTFAADTATTNLGYVEFDGSFGGTALWPAANLGSGSANSGSALYGDQTYKPTTNSTPGTGIGISAGAVSVLSHLTEWLNAGSNFLTMSGSNLLHLNATNLEGSLPAIPGSNLTSLNATTLAGALPYSTLPGSLGPLSTNNGAALTNIQATALPANLITLNTNDAQLLTNLTASSINGTVPAVHLGSGTANAGSSLYGDQTYKVTTNSTPGTGIGITAGAISVLSHLTEWLNVGSNFSTMSGSNLLHLDSTNLEGTLPYTTLPGSLGPLSTNNGVALTNIQAGALPANLITLNTNDAKNLTNIPASSLNGTVPAGNLGSGTANAGTSLYGDQTYKVTTNLTATAPLAISSGVLSLPANLVTLNTNDAKNLTNVQASALPANLITLNTNDAKNLTNIQAAALPANLTRLNTNDGQLLTNIPAGQLTGTVPYNALPSGAVTNNYTGSNNFNSLGVANLTAASLTVTGGPSGNFILPVDKGTGLLVSGVYTVSTPYAYSTNDISASYYQGNNTNAILTITNIVPGVSFQVLSSYLQDTNLVWWRVIAGGQTITVGASAGWNGVSSTGITNTGIQGITNAGYATNWLGEVTGPNGSITTSNFMVSGSINLSGFQSNNMFIMPKLWGWYPVAGNNALTYVGDAGSTFGPTGTENHATASSFCFIRYTNSATALSSNGTQSTYYEVPLKNASFQYTFDVTNTSNLRCWIGLSCSGSAGSAISQQTVTGAARHGAWFYCDTTNDTHWEFVTADGSAFQQWTNTSMTVTTNVTQMQMSITASAGTITGITAYMNGVPMATNTIHLPTSPMLIIYSITTTTAAANALDVFGMQGASSW